MLSVIFLFMQDSPFLLLCFLNTLTSDFVPHGPALSPREPRPRRIPYKGYYTTKPPALKRLILQRLRERCCEYYGNCCCRVCGGWEMRSFRESSFSKCWSVMVSADGDPFHIWSAVKKTAVFHLFLYNCTRYYSLPWISCIYGFWNADLSPVLYKKHALLSPILY